jgi:hypothetical protein
VTFSIFNIAINENQSELLHDIPSQKSVNKKKNSGSSTLAFYRRKSNRIVNYNVNESDAGHFLSQHRNNKGEVLRIYNPGSVTELLLTAFVEEAPRPLFSPGRK